MSEEELRLGILIPNSRQTKLARRRTRAQSAQARFDMELVDIPTLCGLNWSDRQTGGTDVSDK
jgi:hypothetical protein